MNDVPVIEAQKVPIILFCNNWVGVQVLKWLVACEWPLSGVILHAPQHAYFYNMIKDQIKASSLPYFEYQPGRADDLLHFLKKRPADMGISAYFGYILNEAHLALFPRGILNIHGGYLPWCRGKNPNAWAIFDQSPAGITLHLIDKEIDQGQLVSQYTVAVTPDMSAKDLYQRLERLALESVKADMPRLLRGELVPRPMPRDEGSFHAGKELGRLKEINLDEPTTARAFLRQLQAAHFPPFEGASFEDEGVRYSVMVSIERVLE